MTRPGIEPRSSGPLTNTLLIRPMGNMISKDYNSKNIFTLKHCKNIISKEFVVLLARAVKYTESISAEG